MFLMDANKSFIDNNKYQYVIENQQDMLIKNSNNNNNLDL